MRIDNGGRAGFGARLGADGFAGGGVSADRCLLGDFVAGVGAVDLSAVDGDVFVERATGSGRDEVLPAGRFLLSGMRLKIIPSLTACDQLDQSTSFTVTLKRTDG